jgi:hypothetical protein
MNFITKNDSLITGAFAGMLFLCFLMLAVPEKKTCEVSVTYSGGRVEVVRYGVMAKY